MNQLKPTVAETWPSACGLPDSAAAESAAQIDVQEITRPEAVEKLREFWLKSNLHPDADIDYYSLVASVRPEVISPFLLVAGSEQQPKAILIGRLEHHTIPLKLGYFPLSGIKVRQLTFLQQGFLGHADSRFARAMVSKIINLLKQGVADRAVLYNLDVNSELYRQAKTVPAILLRDRAREANERWITSLPATMDEFLKRRSKKHRYWLKRIGRVFEEAHKGQVKYRTYATRADVAAFCDVAESIARTTYQRGLGVGFIDNDEHRRRVSLAAEKGWLKAYAAFVGEEPVAFWCARLYNQAMYLDWTGYKPDYRKYELGTILFLRMVEDICASGATEINYGGGASFYKERFGDQNLREESVGIYAPTLKGVAVGLVKSVEAIANRTAKAAITRLGIVDRIKKRWRGRLATSAAKEPARTEDSGPEGA